MEVFFRMVNFLCIQIKYLLYMSFLHFNTYPAYISKPLNIFIKSFIYQVHKILPQGNNLTHL